jgi:hypothetical protein
MGYYINPIDMTKERWLNTFANFVGSIDANKEIPKWEDIAKGDILPVILVDNGMFTAAGVAYSEQEYKAFTDPRDKRARELYTAKVDDLLRVVRNMFGQLEPGFVRLCKMQYGKEYSDA